MTDTPLPEDGAAATPPRECPRCGDRTEAGYLVIRAMGSPYMLGQMVSWNEATARDDRPGEKVDDLWTSALGGHPWLKGYRCPECEYLELGYGKSGLNRDGWSLAPSRRRPE